MQYPEEYIDLEKLAEGDPELFRRLFMRYYPKVKLFINCMVKSEAVAEDLSQDIFEYIWTNKEHLSGVKSFNAYLFGIARNKSCNYLTHKIVEEDYTSSYKNMQEYLPEEEIYAKELELLIQMTVERMPEQRRRIFELSRMKNLKNAEIAQKLNISKKTVENHLNHALKQIRKVISLSLIFFF